MIPKRRWTLRVPVTALLAAAWGAWLIGSHSSLNAARAFALSLPAALVLALLSQSSQYLLLGNALHVARRAHTTLSVLGGAVFSGAVFAASLCLSLVWLGQAPSLALPPLLFASGLLGYGFHAAFFVVRAAQQSAFLAEQRRIQAQLHAREAELAALTAKVAPHFLFNSLTSIAALTSKDPAGARTMCLNLANLLRRQLAATSEHTVSLESQLVPLREELLTVRLYLDIERVRFSDRLQVDERLHPDCLDVLVPGLILQPLVENAIKHGIAQLEDGGIIQIEGHIDQEQLMLCVSNPTPSVSARVRHQSQGTALIKRRLGVLYGDEAQLLGEQKGESYTATLLIPTRAQFPEGTHGIRA